MADRARVVITDYLAEPTYEREVLADLADLHPALAADEDELLAQVAGADALLVFHSIQVTARVIEALDRCKCIVRVGVGYDNVDGAAAGKKGIVVCNVPDYGTEEVADHAMTLLLAVVRRLIPTDRFVREGHWDRTTIVGAPRLRGTTLGLVGCGRIGTAMAQRARSFGMRIVFYDPYLPPGYEKALGVERVASFPELLGQADIVSLHCPLTDETRHLLNRDTFAQMRPGTYLVNTARGGCVDTQALVNALDQGQLAAAGIDVVDREPLDDERLRQHPRVVLTPHVAYYSVEAFIEMRTKAALEVRRCLEGTPPVSPINLEELVHPRCPVPRRAGPPPG